MEQIEGQYSGKNIIITGGGGYLGSKLAERFSNIEANIFLLDIQFNEISKGLIQTHKHINKINADLTDYDELKRQLAGFVPDYIFHFAGLLHRNRDFAEYDTIYNANVLTTLNLLQCFQKVPYKNFIFTSTSEVYGTTNKTPFNEEQLPLPASPYSLTKLMAENVISVFSNIYNKPYTVLRLFNFYGDDMPEHFFLSQLMGCLKKNEEFAMTAGEQIRDFTEIKKLVKDIIKISCKQNAIGKIINICSGEGIALKDIATKIACEQNKGHLLHIGALPYRPNEIWNMIGDNARLEAILSSEE
jgi:nucleoside-diphosphate-sugar epimerase